MTLRVLFVTPELGPWAKVGGLGDVSSDLPVALSAAGVDVRLLVPAYPALSRAFPDTGSVASLSMPGAPFAPARLRLVIGTVPIYLLDCPEYYARPGNAYQSPERVDWPDNHRRFGLLSRVAATLGGADSPVPWRPDIVHCQDWTGGLAPAYLAYEGGPRAATVMTIHNLAHPGSFPAHVLGELGIPASAFTSEGVEFYGNLSFLKAGLKYASQLTTVSRGYAAEIQGPALGCGLDGLLRARSQDLTGIPNGIDTGVWDPARDRHLARPYDVATLERKRENKRALQRSVGLPEASEWPVFGMVSRLVWQKGVDILADAVPRIVAEPAQIVLLGEGDPGIRGIVDGLASRHPRHFAAPRVFEDRLAHQVIAGADALLAPSRFEPCGLTHVQGMRYGTPPVARRTGGLADWIVDTNEASLRAGTATGFLFDEFSADALVAAVRRALDAWRLPDVWRALQRNGMARSHGWDEAVPVYVDVYRRARETAGSEPSAQESKCDEATKAA